MWSAVKESELRAFWPSDDPLRVLATKWGCSDAYISQRAKHIGLPSRQPRGHAIRQIEARRGLLGSAEARQYLVVESIKRNTNTARLISRLMDVIVKDKLVDAILDDGIETA
jgi:hypothetical protein